MKPKYLYLARMDGTNRFKIGVSRSPKHRVRNLAHTTGAPVRLIHAVASCTPFAAEAMAHGFLSDFALGGEWFGLDAPALRRAIRVLDDCAVDSEKAQAALTEGMPATNLSARKAADRLQVSPQTVLRWIQRGVFADARLFGGVYRIPEAEVERVLRDGPQFASLPTDEVAA